MVGSRQKKKSKLKSKALNLVPDLPEEPVPLNIINVEAAVSPPDEESKKNDVLDTEIAPVFGGWIEEEQQMTDELVDEEEATEYAINDVTVDGNEAVLARVDTKEEYVSDGSDAATNEDADNSYKETGEEEPEENVNSEGDAVTNVDVENSNDGINEEEAEEDEEEEEEEEEELEEDVSDGGDAVTIMDVVNRNNDRTNDEETEEDEEPVSCGSDNEDEHTDEEEEEEEEAEEEDVSDEGDTVTDMDVENSNETANEEETEVEKEDITETLTNISQVENSTVNLENGKDEIESAAKDPISATAENVGDKSVQEIATTITEVKTDTEKVILPRKKFIGKRLIKKKMPLGTAVTAINGTKLQSRDKLGEASERSKTGILKSGEEQVKPTVKIVKKLNVITKKKPQGQSGMQKGNVVQKPKPSNDESSIKDDRTVKQETKNEEAGNSIARTSRLNKRKCEKDLDKPGSSEKGKLTKKVDSMGMIFMCTSRTKKDCYKYKVFGLPAGKKEIVSKIYKGMRLFLYDVNSKTLNGIYKATGPGGFNVEPRAFKSQFPSQVRFSVLQNCLPIPEEKFKKVIKDNYYSRNKFHCELTGDQAKNLCKLFSETTKKSESRYPSPNRRPVATSSTQVDRKRKRAEDSRRVRRDSISSREHEGRRERRRSPIARDREVRYRQPVVVYDRESYLPRVESSSLYQSFREDDPPRSRTYSYERDPEVDTYRRDPYAVAYTESRVYREPVYESNIRRHEEYGFSSPEGRYAEFHPSDDYRPPLRRQEEYGFSSPEGRYAEYHPSDDYRPPLTLRRRH